MVKYLSILRGWILFNQPFFKWVQNPDGEIFYIVADHTIQKNGSGLIVRMSYQDMGTYMSVYF